MQGKGRRRLLTVMSIIVMLAMVMLWPTGSQAQAEGVPAADLFRRPEPVPGPEPVPRPKGVPEPNTSVLLLLGIGLTGLVGYSLQRCKQGE